MPLELLQAFQQRMVRVHGEAGKAWLQAFAGTCEALCRRWRISLGAPFALSYNFVALAERGSERLVLKLGVPNPELTGEIEALIAFAGRGAAAVFEADAALGALLLERLEPGTPLAALEDDDRATAIAAEVLSRLWFEPPEPRRFRTVHVALRSLRRLARVAPYFQPGLLRTLLDHAGRALAQLEAATPLGSAPRPALLLHGDFHHGNILQGAGGEWHVIDAKGALGERAFDLAPLIRNHLLECAHPAARLLQRVERLARELSLSADHILRWAFVGTLLSAAWSLEDGEPADAAIESGVLMARALGLAV